MDFKAVCVHYVAQHCNAFGSVSGFGTILENAEAKSSFWSLCEL
jgi:general stress protein 26